MKFKSLFPSARRLSAFLVLLALLCGTFCGCGVIIINRPDDTTEAATTLPPETSSPSETTAEPETEAPPETTEIPEETVVVTPVTFPSRIEEAEQRLDELSNVIDISGFNLIIASSGDTADIIFCEEESPLYAARSTRNSMLYDKYEVEIRTIYESVDTDKIYADLLSVAQTGATNDFYLDLIVIPANRAGGFLAKGLIKDMRSLPFYNTKDGSQSGNVGDARYFDLGDGTDAPEYIYSIYFNRDLVGKETEDLLYSASLDGNLTWDMLITASRSVAGSEADMGAVNNDNSLAGVLAPYLAGIDFVTKDQAGVPMLTISDSAVLTVDSLIDTVAKLNFYTPAEDAPSAIDKFKAGTIPFYMGTLSEISDLYDEKVEWGLLTLPSDKNIGAISDNRPVICIPETSTRLEQTSIWLTAFNAASGDWIRDEFLTVAKDNYLRDNNSCLTLYKILSQKTELSFEQVFAGYYEDLADATFGAAGNALTGSVRFSETFAKKVSAVNKKLAKLP